MFRLCLNTRDFSNKPCTRHHRATSSCTATIISGHTVTGTLFLPCGCQTSVLSGRNIGDLGNWWLQYLDRIYLARFSFIVEIKDLALLIIAKKRPLLVSVWYGGNIGFCPPAVTTPTSVLASSSVATASAATSMTKFSPVASTTTTLCMKCRDLLAFSLAVFYKTGQKCRRFRKIVLMIILNGNKRFTCYKPDKFNARKEILNWYGPG